MLQGGPTCLICTYLGICFCSLPRREHWLTEAFGLLWLLLNTFNLTGIKKPHSNSQNYLSSLEWQDTACCRIPSLSEHVYCVWCCTGRRKPSKAIASTPLCSCTLLQEAQLPPNRWAGSSSVLACLQNSSGRACFETTPGFGNCASEKVRSPLIRRHKQLSALRIYSLALTRGLFKIYQISFHLSWLIFHHNLREKQVIFWRGLSTMVIGGMEDTRNTQSPHL